MKLQDVRREYLRGGLTREQLNSDPILQFEQWLQQALEVGLSDPTAMTLATVDATGQPSQRIVLLKQVDQQGFVFFTNTKSRKAQEIADNNKVSLHFPWYPMERQVIVCGEVSILNEKTVQDYFSSRPRDSQLGAWASAQSQVIPSREVFVAEYERLQAQYADMDIPLPEFWGGYCVKPVEIEFWQGGEHRLHDRFRYTLTDDKQWQIDRLAP